MLVVPVSVLGLDVNDTTDSCCGRHHSIGRKSTTRGLRHSRYCRTRTNRQGKGRAFVFFSQATKNVPSIASPDRHLIVAGLGNDVLHLVLSVPNILDVARDRHATAHNVHRKLIRRRWLVALGRAIVNLGVAFSVPGLDGEKRLLTGDSLVDVGALQITPYVIHCSW